MASDKTNGSIEVRLDSLTGKLLAKCVVSSNQFKNKWHSIQCPIAKVKGIHDVYLVFKGTGNNMFDFDWWRIKK